MKRKLQNFCHTNTKNPGNNLGIFCLITGRPKLNGYETIETIEAIGTIETIGSIESIEAIGSVAGAGKGFMPFQK